MTFSTGDLPPLILSPSQYHNYTQPRGNFIPYANEDRAQYRSDVRGLTHSRFHVLSMTLSHPKLHSPKVTKWHCSHTQMNRVTVIHNFERSPRYRISKRSDKHFCLHHSASLSILFAVHTHSSAPRLLLFYRCSTSQSIKNNTEHSLHCPCHYKWL